MFPATMGSLPLLFGYYRTRDLILAYMNALAAGDTESVATVGPK